MLAEKGVERMEDFENGGALWNIYMESVKFYFLANEITGERQKKKFK